MPIEAAGARYEAYRHARSGGPVRPGDADGMNPLEYVARTMLLNPQHRDELLDAAARLAPDVVLVDQMLWSATAAAESLEVPHAVLWHTIYGGWGGLRALPAFTRKMLDAERRALDLPAVDHVFEQAERAAAIIAFTLERFDAVPDPRPPNLHYVGPLSGQGQPVADVSLPWPAKDDRPLVLVSFSTSFMDQAAAFQRVADALGELDARGLLTVGPAIDPATLTLPANVVAESFVPHAVVLPHANLLITHAGHGTTMAGVTAGIPLLCMPMGRDQFEVSARVQANALGRVIAQDAAPDELRDVVATMLDDAELRDRCCAFASSVDLDQGRRRAIEVLEGLAHAP